jgi:hypothetical protein
MSSVIISGDTSGAITVSAPAVSGTNTLTLQAATATSAVNTLATAKAYNWNGLTTNTSLDFTDLPSWIKRITVMFQGVSTNGSSNLQCQIGAGSVTSSGYLSSSAVISGGTAAAFTAGFGIANGIGAGTILHGSFTITSLGSNSWAVSGTMASSNAANVWSMAGSITLGGTLDRIRLTTVLGVDFFDAGTVNILYEG